MYTWIDILYGVLYIAFAMVVSIVIGYYFVLAIFPSPENIDILMYEQHILNQPRKPKR
jgi:hypothetical protein